MYKINFRFHSGSRYTYMDFSCAVLIPPWNAQQRAQNRLAEQTTQFIVQTCQHTQWQRYTHWLRVSILMSFYRLLRLMRVEHLLSANLSRHVDTIFKLKSAEFEVSLLLAPLSPLADSPRTPITQRLTDIQRTTDSYWFRPHIQCIFRAFAFIALQTTNLSTEFM